MQAIPKSLLLLVGPAGAGKSIYCRQFILDGLLNDDFCIFISANLDEKQFPKDARVNGNLKFIDPYLQAGLSKRSGKGGNGRGSDWIKLSAILTDIESALSPYAGSGRSIRLVIDSLTHLSIIFKETALLKFIHSLAILLRDYKVAGIFTLTGTDLYSANAVSKLSCIVDGILEMKLEDSGHSLSRSIRLLSIKGIHHTPKWIEFSIDASGILAFGDSLSKTIAKCPTCNRPVTGKAISYSDFTFDTILCMQTYLRLKEYYSANVFDSGLSVGVSDVNFFFIDIVSLSDQSLPVEKQIEKIENLNELVGSCEAFKRTEYRGFSFPTGDGMAIGFLLNPEIPLKLAIELHKKLAGYNRGKPNSDRIDVRIGLASGPVFMVNDINNNRNVWGPEIVLARRVMDIGDSGHILLADRLAEDLIALKAEYRDTIKLVNSDYQIKHGQRIRLYSAYSTDFGNSNIPSRISP